MTRQFSAGRLLLAVVALASASALAQGVPSTVSFTGNLTNSSGPVSGNHAFVFTLYDSLTAGTAVGWTETQPAVPVTNGLVFASLGSVTPFTALVFNGAPLFLEVKVDGTTLAPRLAFQSVPYAVRAGVANACEALGALAPGDVVNITANQTIAGVKTFSSPIAASITGNAATATSFSGALVGDVTGTQGATRVARIQGVAVAPTAPANTQVLTYNAGAAAWQPQPQPAIKFSAKTTTVGLTTAPAAMQSLDVTFPAAGAATILAQCEFSAITAGTYVGCSIGETDGSTTTTTPVFDWDPGDVDGWYDQAQSFTWPKAVTAGLKTYKLTCNSNTGTQSAFGCQLIVTYFPGGLLP